MTDEEILARAKALILEIHQNLVSFIERQTIADATVSSKALMLIAIDIVKGDIKRVTVETDRRGFIL